MTILESMQIHSYKNMSSESGLFISTWDGQKLKRDLYARGKTDNQESQKSEVFGEWGFVSKGVKSPTEIHKPSVFCLVASTCKEKILNFREV